MTSSHLPTPLRAQRLAQDERLGHHRQAKLSDAVVALSRVGQWWAAVVRQADQAPRAAG